MIQGYEEKNNATVEMMNDMRKMFDEKLQALERENEDLKEKANFKKRIEYTKYEMSLADQRKELSKKGEQKQVKVTQKVLKI